MLDSMLIGLIIISFVAYRKEALSLSGMIGLYLIGVLTAVSFSYKGLIVLSVFFITANLASLWARYSESTIYHVHNEHPKRTIIQVFANGYMAIIAAIGHLIVPSPLWIGLLVGAISEANADTWASEIGVTSRTSPRSVINFKVLPHGVSGGVTIKGLIASMFGAAMISILPLVLWPTLYSKWLNMFLLFLLVGFLGAYLDSILGECFQVRYRCSVCRQLTDESFHCQKDAVKIKGVFWMTNNVVNTLATGISGLIGGVALLWLII